MNTPGEKTVDDHWRYQRDTINLMAEKLVPFMVDGPGCIPRNTGTGGDTGPMGPA